MKKLTALLLCLTMLLTLTACGLKRTVPDRMIDRVIDDFLNENEYLNCNYYGGLRTHKSTVSHSPDSVTKTDTVKIDLVTTYPTIVAVSSYEATYQYDKSTDSWSVIRGGKWDPVKVTRYDLCRSVGLWCQSIENAGLTPWIDNDTILDLNPSDDELRDLLSCSTDSWGIHADSHPYYNILQIYYNKMPSERDARDLYEDLHYYYKKLYGELGYFGYYDVMDREETKGENYVYSRLLCLRQGTDVIEEAWGFICVDDAVYTLHAANGTDELLEYKMDLFLQEIGFAVVKEGP